MTCAACGGPIAAGHRFCPACGQALRPTVRAQVGRRVVAGLVAAVLGCALVLVATTPSRSDWVQWQVQQGWHDHYASSNPYGDDVLVSYGVLLGTTGNVGYIGILGHWVEAMNDTIPQTTSQGLVYDVPDPYRGFWGWVYRLIAPPA